MARPAEVLYTQAEADAVIHGSKSITSVGYVQRIGDQSNPKRVQLTCGIELQSPVYNPKDFGKEVRLVIAIRKHDGFSFMLLLDRTILHQVDYQWRPGRKACKCRDFEMDYEPHIHTYEESCYRSRRHLFLDELPSLENTFADALQSFLSSVHADLDARLETRFAEFLHVNYWGKGAQATLFPVSEVLDDA